MRFYFHICNGPVEAEDEHGMELPDFMAAFEEGQKIAQDLLNDPQTVDLHGGVIHIVGPKGMLFVSLPIMPAKKRPRALH